MVTSLQYITYRSVVMDKYIRRRSSVVNIKSVGSLDLQPIKDTRLSYGFDSKTTLTAPTAPELGKRKRPLQDENRNPQARRKEATTEFSDDLARTDQAYDALRLVYKKSGFRPSQVFTIQENFQMLYGGSFWKPCYQTTSERRRESALIYLCLFF